MSPDYSVVYLSSIDWAFRKQDHQFISTELASRGHPVLFVENTGARMPAPADLGRVVSRLRNWSRSGSDPPGAVPAGIEVASPLCIPGAGLGVERVLNRWLLGAQLRPGLQRLGDRPRVAWLGLPTWTSLDLAKSVRPHVLVYYCGDAFTRLPGLRAGIAESERETIRAADLVFATSASLVAHCRALGAHPIAVPVAIDTGASAAAREGRAASPTELRGLRGRIIGYMGGLNYKVDVELLNAVSEAFPEDTLVILGSIEDPSFSPRAASNVVILGERPYERIAEYIARFDVCLIPYRSNEYTDAVSPAKLLEYLAVGRPVVSTPLPEVLAFGDVVSIAATTEVFVSAIRSVLARPDSPQARDARIRRAMQNTYEIVGAQVVDIVEQHLRLRRS